MLYKNVGPHRDKIKLKQSFRKLSNPTSKIQNIWTNSPKNALGQHEISTKLFNAQKPNRTKRKLSHVPTVMLIFPTEFSSLRHLAPVKVTRVQASLV